MDREAEDGACSSPRAFTRSRADFKQMVLACDFAPTLWKHPLVRTLFGLDGRDLPPIELELLALNKRVIGRLTAD